jgi:putative phosphoesterase
MRIGVISDTHDRLPTIDRALAVFRERRVEAILHLGDIIAPFAAKKFTGVSVPLYVIYGNNDGERAGLKKMLPQIVDGPLAIELGGRRLLLHHFIDWLTPEQVAGADAVLTGHTHEVVNEVRDGRLFLNPGECCGWVTGCCTVAVLETKTLSVEVVDLTP